MVRTQGMKKYIIIATLLSLTGCAADPNNHTLIVLEHPETKQTVQCKGDAWASWNVYAETEKCAEAYEKAGYKRLGSY